MIRQFKAALIRMPGYAWLAWGLGALLFFSEYFARISPSVMVPDLMRDFHVTAWQLGSLSAFFYYPYILMQLPVGMLVDRFGPHKLLTATAAAFSLSCLLFASTQTLWLAEVGRFCMGFSAAFAFVGALKLAKVWFPAARFGLLAGFTQALGMLGAAFGDAPVSLAVEHFGWRTTIQGMAAVFAVLAVLIGLLVYDNNHQLKKQSEFHNHISEMLFGLKHVLRNPQTWLNGLVVGLLYAPSAAFGELWGVNYLHVSYGFTNATAALGISLIFIGWGVGGPVAGALSDKINRRKPVMLLSGLCGALFLGAVLYIPDLSKTAVFSLLFLYGATNTGVAVSYALSSEINLSQFAGTSMAFANMSSVLIGAGLQPIIGCLLDIHAKTFEHGIPVLTHSDFRFALIALPLCSVGAAIAGLWLKETHCQNSSD